MRLEIRGETADDVMVSAKFVCALLVVMLYGFTGRYVPERLRRQSVLRSSELLIGVPIVRVGTLVVQAPRSVAVAANITGFPPTPAVVSVVPEVEPLNVTASSCSSPMT